MRTSIRLAIASSSFLLIGYLIACGSSDSGGPSYGGAGATAGSAGFKDGGGGAITDGKVEGGGGTGSFIIPTDTSTDVPPQEDACAGNVVQATLKPAHMLLLIDRSGSMNCNPPPTATDPEGQTTAECEATPVKKYASKPSKWEITRDAFIAALGDLKVTIPTPSVGISLFSRDGYCQEPVLPDVEVKELTDQQVGDIVTALNPVVPKGDTPIVGSLIRAYDYLSQQQVTGNKFVVLLTDGGETCDPQNKEWILTKAVEATWIGIRTFVLGAPGSEGNRSFLSTLAFNGGTATDTTCSHDVPDAGTIPPTEGNCHIDMTQENVVFKDALAAALAKVSGAALSCEIDVPSDDGGKADPRKVNVLYVEGENGTEHWINPDVSDAGSACNENSESMWQYANDAKTKIQVCGPICTQIKADQKGSLSVQLGCETIIPK